MVNSIELMYNTYCEAFSFRSVFFVFLFCFYYHRMFIAISYPLHFITTKMNHKWNVDNFYLQNPTKVKKLNIWRGRIIKVLQSEWKCRHANSFFKWSKEKNLTQTLNNQNKKSSLIVISPVSTWAVVTTSVSLCITPKSS